jgi:hypothetical protein
MAIEFRNPSEDESAMMQEFGVLVSQAVDLIIKHELGNFGGLIANKLQEAMLWHSHALLNKPKADAPKEGELQQANPVE